jgi:hypothetical protein
MASVLVRSCMPGHIPAGITTDRAGRSKQSFFARRVSRSVSCHRSNFSCVRIAAHRRWTCVKGKNLRYAGWRQSNERATSGRSAEECVEPNDLTARSAQGIPSRRCVCGEPGFESGFGKNDLPGYDSYPTAASLSSPYSCDLGDTLRPA